MSDSFIIISITTMEIENNNSDSWYIVQNNNCCVVILSKSLLEEIMRLEFCAVVLTLVPMVTSAVGSVTEI